MRTLRSSRAMRVLTAATATAVLATVASVLTAGGAAAGTTTVDGVTASTPDLSVVSFRKMVRKGGVVTSEGSTALSGSFSLKVDSSTAFEEVRLSLRSPDHPGDVHDAGRVYGVTVSGRKTFSASTTLPDGTWTAAALWSRSGRWNMGPRTSFVVQDGTVTELASPVEVTAPAPSPSASPSPTSSPTATPTATATATPTASPTTAPAPSPTSSPSATAAPAPSPTSSPTPTSSFSTTKSGDFESAGFSDWQWGAPNVLPNPGASVVQDGLAYDGSYGAKASIPGGSGNKYARTLWGGVAGQTGSLNYGEGTDFTFGMALYLPVGFHASMQSYFVPMRWDNYGVTNVSRSGISMFKDGTFRLFRERAGVENAVNLLGSTTFRLTEGEWHWLEVRQVLSSRDGSALNELWVDGKLIGSSTARNYYGEPMSTIRYGIVAIADGAQTLPLTVHYDRVVLGKGRLGPR